MRSMINEMLVDETINNDIRTLLDAQIIFKRAGVVEITGNTGGDYINTDNLIYEKITLIFSPRTYYLSQQETTIINDDVMKIYFKRFMGDDYSETTNIPRADIGGIPIMIEIENSNHLIGHYFRTNNFIIISQKIFQTDISNPNKKRMFIEICEKISESIKRLKPKRVSTKDFVLNKLTETFIVALKKEKIRLIRELEDSRRGIDNCVTLVANYSATINSYEEIVSGIEKQILNGKSSLKKSVKQVSLLPFIKEVHLTKTGIYMDFKPLQITHLKVVVNVGRIRLQLRDNKIKVYNMDAVSSGGWYDHPHVSDSNPCLGPHGISVGKLVGNMKLREIAIFYFTFLRKYNPRNPHINIQAFKLLREEFPVLDEPFPECGKEREYLLGIRNRN